MSNSVSGQNESKVDFFEVGIWTANILLIAGALIDGIETIVRLSGL